MFRISLGILTSFLLGVNLYGQVFYSNGATVQVTNGGILFVNGGAGFAASSVVDNQGEITVTKNSSFPFPGNFSITGASTISGNGDYRVEQDWINDANFIADNSNVELFGNTLQNITSSNGTSTIFHNLQLTGNGTGNDRKKQLTGVNASTDATGTLSINDRELSTDAQVFFVLNPQANSVTNSVAPGAEGFVSSLSGGYLSRVTNSNQPYLFPTGSSLGTLRYRPVVITPTDAFMNDFRARLNNQDATADGFDRNFLALDVCKTNPLFYHSVIRAAGPSDANLTISYLPAADGTWNHTAHWTSAVWNNMDPVTAATIAGFSTLTKSGWTFTDPDHPFILSDIRPLPPQITCPQICENSSGNIFTATGSSSGYQWTMPVNGSIVSGQGSGQVNVNWTNGTGTVYVYAPGVGGCNSLPDSCSPTVLPNLMANFNMDTTYAPYSLSYDFTDATVGSTDWIWDFGDGYTSVGSAPSHTFPGPGEYLVTLTATNNGACPGKFSRWVEIQLHRVFVPNSFTPNEDDLNDTWFPVGFGLNTIPVSPTLRIFNRWGEEIFVSGTSDKPWNGYNDNFGTECPMDVYVFRFEYNNLTTTRREVILGHINLIR